MDQIHLNQQEIYFDQILDSSSPHYNIGTYVVIKGELNIELFKESIRSSENVFDVYRFQKFSTNAPSAVINESAINIQIEEVDFTGNEWSDQAVKRWLQERINKPFDIHSRDLYDFVLLKRDEGEFWFYFGCHHLFSDGYGVPYILLKYIFDKYHALRTGEEQTFDFPSYLELVEKSRDYLGSESYESDKNYWRERFSSTQTPILQQKRETTSNRTDTVQLFFSSEEQNRLRAFCEKNKISLQDFLIAVLAVYYHKTSGLLSFDFSLPTHNRTNRKERNTLGLFSKLIPCRINLENLSLAELFGEIKSKQRQDYRHKQFPVSHFNKMIQSENNPSKPFDICVNYRYFRLNTNETELSLKGYKNDASFSMWPIEFSWCDFGENGVDDLFLEIIFREDYFEKTEIELLSQRLLSIIDQFYDTDNNQLDLFNVLPEQEKQELLYAFNDTKVAYPTGKTVVHLFEDQVEKTPDNVAVVFEDKELTYQELNERSNQLAHYLQTNYAINPEDLVGIKQDRSEWMIISVLGVLKSGGAYVSIDPNYPQDRIDFIEKDTGCKVCLDESELIKFQENEREYSTERVVSEVTSNTLAYVIYTSGSTGLPKGVMITHQNVYSFIQWSHNEFASSDFEEVLFTTSLNFDLSVFEMLHPLTTGKSLRVLKDGLSISEHVDTDRKLLINTVPSVVGALLQEKMNFDSVSVLNMAGEPIPSGYKDELKGKVEEIRNLYGPSEDTTYSTFIRIDKDPRDLIGKPVSNTQIYILNEKEGLQPIGVIGEICISGDGLARGYLNRETLTTEKFIHHPFKDGERLYKTGDLGRWLPDGNIEFVGRKDDQVKIRGYRIELGEIEHVLSKHESVEQAVILAKENETGQKELVAYLTAQKEQNTNDLRSYLKESLPEYMLPSYFVQLEEMPLTPNGKIDRKSLPDPQGLGMTSGVEYVAPRNEIEKKLVTIWEEVLQRDKIGVLDDFFQLGGHSLKATKLIGEYHKVFDVKLTFTEVFNYTNIESHFELLSTSKKEEFTRIPRVSVSDFEENNLKAYPISDAQRRLWVLSQFEKGSVAYNIPEHIYLNEEIDIHSFNKAIDATIERHEILRTVFRANESGEVRQWILGREDLDFLLDYKDYRKEVNSEESAQRYIHKDAYKPFDLENGPLMRASLIQIEDSKYILYFNMHHIISDGWSMEVLSNDVFSYYEAFKENKAPELRDLRIQYKDYSAWQLKQLTEASFKSHRAYWLENLSGELPLLDLPGAKQRPRLKTYNGEGLRTYFDKETALKLKAYAQDSGGSLFISLLSVWNVLMYRYTSQSDIIIGSPIAGREHSDLEDQIGFYVNTLALRNNVDPEESFNDFNQRVQENTLKSYSHQMYPFDRLVDELDVQRDTSRNPVFDVMLILQNNGERQAGFELSSDDLNSIKDLGKVTSKFEITVTFEEVRDYLLLDLVYNPDVYDREMIEGLIHHFKNLLGSLLAAPEQKVAEVDYLSEQEKQELLCTFNDTKAVYPTGKTIVDLFEDQVEKTPGNVAVVFEDKELTYQELNERSNQLAHYLQTNYAIKPEDLVGIKQDRSEWMIISVLGVLKSGGAYVSIDPNYPQDRIDFIEKDTSCKVCLDESELIKFQENEREYSTERVVSEVTSNTLAYVIYTSGSTGLPKGVMITHQNVYSFIQWSHNEFASSDFEEVLFTTSLNFDLSVFEMLHPLTTGKSLRVLQDGLSISKHVETDSKLLINTVPSVVGALLQEKMNFDSVSVLNMAGEPIPSGYKDELKGKVEEIRNLYGPSEDTTYSTFIRIDKDQRDLIGKPVSNTQIYILNEKEGLQPIGVIGEICISGDGLARGYLNRETLTTEKFIHHPFKDGERLYKTGDLGRWLPDGNIEFVGRKDEQVKIRGYRIELGEIEHVLSKHELVEQAVILAKENETGQKELVAYLTAQKEQNTNDLRSYLKKSLPEYMLPSYFVQLEEMPLTPNGKIDRKSLPDPQGVGMTSGVEYVAPRNEIEKKLVTIWEEVLQRDKIGVLDDFFQLGGHSLKAIRLINDYQQEFEVKLSIDQLFTSSRLELHSELISASESAAFVRIEKQAEQESYPISDAQRRLWILNQFEKSSAAYNIPGKLKLKGKYELELLQESFNRVIDRHEILRTVFKSEETGEVRQWVLDSENSGFVLDYVDCRNEPNKKSLIESYIAEDSDKAFDLAMGPLLRASLLQMEDDEYVLYYNMHHIISDGWSMEVLSNDVFAYYDALKENKVPELEDLRIQYKDYSVWQLERLEESSELHRAYWLDNLSGELPVLDLPSTKQRPRLKTFNGQSLSTFIDANTSHQLKKYSKENGGSLFMGLLATWNAMMYRYTSQTDIIIGTPIAGRDHVDLENQIGFYLNTLALRNEVEPEESFNKFYQKVKENTLKSYSHQKYPFDRLVDELGLKRDTSRSALFDVMLVLENNEFNRSEFDLNGVQMNQIVDAGSKTSKFDLLVSVQDHGDFLALSMEYNTDVYERGMIENLIRHYKTFILELVSNPEESIAQVRYLSGQERQKLLTEFNDTNVAYSDKTVVQLFESQVGKTPDNIAVEFEGESLTYTELNERSNILAHVLKDKYNISKQWKVGVMLERSIESVIAMIGVMKTGACYVPIDYDYPKDRVKYIVQDSALEVVISEKELWEKYGIQESTLVDIRRLGNESVDTSNLEIINKPEDGSYVIYTSGSTGKPKGVLQSHRMMSNLIQWDIHHSGIERNLKHLQYTSFSFDVSLQDCWAVLSSGGHLHIASKELRVDLPLLWKYIVKNGIQVLSFPFSAFQHLIIQNSIQDQKDVHLKHIVCSGEQLIVNSTLRNFLENNPSIKLHNHYGPSETHVVTAYTMSAPSKNIVNRAPIGKPISNSSMFIVDKFKELVPQGVLGELYIGGKNLANGYLNLDQETAERFIQNPFKEGELLYKTGDLARYLPDGNIEFIGRKDDQLKVRGYRVELGEIENTLIKNEQVNAAVVIAKKNELEENELIAYITSSKVQNANTLRSYLKGILPEYMIPGYFVQLDELPLTPNGKVNKRVLPNPEGLELKSSVKYVAPRNHIEQQLVKIWEELLQRDNIGVKEGFFEAGGNSLKLITLKSKIEKELKLECTVLSLFEYTTIHQQADMLSKENSSLKMDELEKMDSLLIQEDGEHDIAVVGMSIKCPGAENIAEFWKNLVDGNEMITHFTEEELISSGVSKELVNDPNYVKANSYLDGKEYFDSAFFGYMPDEAKVMDPQTRVFHEVVWSAIEDSGYDPLEYKGRISLFAGAGNNLEWEVFSQLTNEGRVNEFLAHQLSDGNFSNTLIAHKLNLKGSANAINSACSTSLVAIHHAARSIISGENHMAVAGGVTVRNNRKEEGYLHQEGMIFSKDGHNRTFDASASGTIDSEGAGAVVLKRLSSAIEDGDQIYAILKGSAINNDGNRKVGYTAPSVEGQSEAIQMAHLSARVKPESISYIEAHGTATNLGDPIEVLALNRAFGQNKTNYCALGSVKSNVGHMAAAAGVAGFIKAALCLKNKVLVPSLHFETPNPQINFEESPFYVNTELKEWEKDDFPLRAGVSSFGIGGTNAHVILEEPPITSPLKESTSTSREIITLSAKTGEALLRQQSNLKDFLLENDDLNLTDVAWTLQNRRAFPFRSSFVAQTIQEACDSLQSALSSPYVQTEPQIRAKKVVFMFSGSGMQYENMGRGLYDDAESVFRKCMDNCFEVAFKYSDTDFKSILYPIEQDENSVNSPINDTINTQPILFMFEYALAKQLEHYGLRPSIMIGHSTGEYATACFSGVLSLEDALRVIIKRGELMQGATGGAMLAVEKSEAEMKQYLSEDIDIAVVNTTENCVVSGKEKAIIELQKRLEKEDVQARILRISCAAHSRMMESILDEFAKITSGIEVNSPRIPYISNLTGKEISQTELDNKNYWSDHIRGTVHFSRGIENLIAQEDYIFVEIGPGNSLCNATRSHFKENDLSLAQTVIRHPKQQEDDVSFLLNKVADLWQSGLSINWKNIHNGKPKNKIGLPTYSFEQTKYPIAHSVQDLFEKSNSLQGFKKRENITEWFYELSWKSERLIPSTQELSTSLNYLVFCDEDKLADDLIGQLQNKGEAKIATVKKGASFENTGKGSFSIRSAVAEDYVQLLRNLEKQDLLPDKVIHVWNYSEEAQGELTRQSVANDLHNGYYSLLNVAHALGSVAPFRNVSIDVISSFVAGVSSADKLVAARASILAPVLTISKEYKTLSCKHIDVKSTSGRSVLLDSLVREISISDMSQKNIAYRDGDRWVQFYGPIKLESNEQLPNKVKHGGIYLVTGGMGGIGSVICSYLVREFDARLIITGRTPLSENISEKLKEFGEESLYLNVDVSDPVEMEKSLKQAEEVLGSINGIVHTAGRVDYGGIIQNREREQSEEVFASKVYGTLVLNDLAAARTLDFVILCSSAASAIAPFGQVAYTAANTFQDVFALSNQNNLIQTIGWDTWKETGMGIYSLKTDSEEERIAHLSHGMTNVEGIEVLNRVLRYGIPNVSISTRDIAQLYMKSEPELSHDSTTPKIVQNRPALSSKYEEPTTEIEKSLCALLTEFFGIKELGIHDDLFELGMDSLKAMRIKSHIHQTLNIELRINDVLENPTIHNLSKKIDSLKGISRMQADAENTQFEHEIEI